MKKWICSLCLISLFPCLMGFLVTSPANAEVVTPEQFLQLVAERNNTVTQTVRNVESLYWAAKVAVAGQRPSLALTGSASHETADGGDNAIAQAGVSHLFDVSGRYSLQERKAVLDYDVSVLELADLVNGTLGGAETLYWTTVLARENIDLYRELLRQREEDLRITREKFKEGLAPELDVIRARAQVEDNKSLLVEAQANYRDGLSSMKAVAGGVDVEPCPDCLEVPENTLVVTVESVLQERPDLKGLALSQERARVVRDLSSKGMAPNLTGNILWTVKSDQAASVPDEGELLASLNLSIPLSDGGKTRSQTRQTEKLIAAAERALEAGKDKARQEFEQASNRWEKAVALERSRNEQASQAKEEMRITQLRYREGLGAQIDLLNAQVGLQQARTGYLEAVKEMYLALVDLRSSRGDYGNNFSPEVAPEKF